MQTLADFRIEIPHNAAGEVYTTCPECSHQRKKSRVRCLSVNADEGVWFCHHCGWKGGIKTGAGREQITHWAKPRYQRPDPERVNGAQLPEKSLEWFALRGITPQVVSRNRIVRETVFMPQVDGMVPAIGFPYYRNSELVNVKWRDKDKNFRQEAGAEQILFGLDDVAGKDTWIWVEGEMDKLSLEVAGFTNCVSVPNGAPNPETRSYSSKFDFIESAADLIGAASCHIIAVDSDAPGKALERELSRRLGLEKCKVVKWPEGMKDANDVLKHFGPGGIIRYIGEAAPYPVEGSVEYFEKYDALMSLYENGMEPGLGTGWPTVDGFYTVKPGEMTVVTGIPNSGKSNWLDALCVNMAQKFGWNFAMFSPENQPIEAHIARMAEKHLFKPFGQTRYERMSAQDLTYSLTFLHQHFTEILPPENSTLDGILEIARQLVLRKGIKGLVIDPWNEVEHDRPANMTETEYVSVCLGKIRRFARKHGVHVWIVAHPMKLRKEQDGNYPVPTPYDISGSAHWRNKADNCITIWRDLKTPTDTVDIHVQKIRFRENGRIGMCCLRYDRDTGCYIDTATGAHCT